MLKPITMAIFMFTIVLTPPKDSYASPYKMISSRNMAEILMKVSPFFIWQKRDSKVINICVYGLEGTDDNLRALNVKYINTISRPDFSRMGECHMVYISMTEQANMNEILWIAKSYDIVTISQIPGFSKMGGAVEVILEGTSISFSINLDRLKRANVWADEDLLNMSETSSVE